MITVYFSVITLKLTFWYTVSVGVTYRTVIPGTEKAVVTLPIDLAIQYVNIKTMKAGSLFSVPFGCRGVAIVNIRICLGRYRERGRIRIREMNGKRIQRLKIPKSVYYSDTECNTVGNII